MAATDRCAEAMEHAVVTATQGHTFVMEQGRLGHLEGKVGSREGLTHRIISESGSGFARQGVPQKAGT